MPRMPCSGHRDPRHRRSEERTIGGIVSSVTAESKKTDRVNELRGGRNGIVLAVGPLRAGIRCGRGISAGITHKIQSDLRLGG